MRSPRFEAHLKWVAEDGNSIPDPSETVTYRIWNLIPEFIQPRGYYVVVEKLSAIAVRSPRLQSAELGRS